MEASEKPSWREKNRILVAVYADLGKAQSVAKRLIDMDCQMDMISVLGRMQATGDDNLGIYHLDIGDRVKAWGTQGALWGGLWGFLVGAGFFMISGIGAVAAAGYIVEAIAGGVAAGAGTMAGAAALSQLAIAFHRTGIPEAEIRALHKAIEDGHYLLMLRCAESEAGKWKELLVSELPLEVHDLPYSRVIDKA
jgi:hypothetical protein